LIEQIISIKKGLIPGSERQLKVKIAESKRQSSGSKLKPQKNFKPADWPATRAVKRTV